MKPEKRLFFMKISHTESILLEYFVVKPAELLKEYVVRMFMIDSETICDD